MISQKKRHCETRLWRVEAIPRRNYLISRGLLRRFAPRNDCLVDFFSKILL
jgi:hypothetical protein